MADIAAIFHWPKAELEALTLPELLGVIVLTSVLAVFAMPSLDGVLGFRDEAWRGELIALGLAIAIVMAAWVIGLGLLALHQRHVAVHLDQRVLRLRQALPLRQRHQCIGTHPVARGIVGKYYYFNWVGKILEEGTCGNHFAATEEIFPTQVGIINIGLL